MKKLLRTICTWLSKKFFGTGIGKYPPFKQLVPFIMRNTHRKKKIKTTNLGFKMELTPYNVVDQCIIHIGEREPEITKLLQENLKEGDSFLDVGANIGYDTLLGSKIVGKSGKVFAIEPIPQIYSELKKNIALNDDYLPNNIKPFNVGAGSKQGMMTIHYNNVGNPGGSSLISNKDTEFFGENVEVKIVKLDELLQGEKIDFIKMDIEGYEREAMKGMERILRETKGLIFEYSPNMKQYDDNILNYLMELGFELFHIKAMNEKSKKQGILTPITDTKLYFKKHVKKGQSDILAKKK